MYLGQIPAQSIERERIPVRLQEISKTQNMRLLDVFFIGPLMITAGVETKNPYFKWGQILIGLGTILYNGNNYLAQKKALDNAVNTLTNN